MAYRIWNGGRSYSAFRRGFARTTSTHVTLVPPFTSEGAAGSIFSEIKVRVDARLTDGTKQRFKGSYTLRRVNDVDGSTPAQRRWHIVAAKLTPAGQ